MIYILGIGNVLLKDDGLGIRVIEELQKVMLPSWVKILDTGTGTLRVLPELVKAKRIIVVDAIQAGGKPGTVYRFTGEEVNKGLIRSVHNFRFQDIIGHLNLMGFHPEVEYFGIEPGEIAFSLGLTPAVQDKIQVLAGYLKDYIIEESKRQSI